MPMAPAGKPRTLRHFGKKTQPRSVGMRAGNSSSPVSFATSGKNIETFTSPVGLPVGPARAAVRETWMA